MPADPLRPLLASQTALGLAEQDFASGAAQKLRFVKKEDWEQKVTELYEYCELNGYSKESAEEAIKQAKELKIKFAQEQT